MKQITKKYTITISKKELDLFCNSAAIKNLDTERRNLVTENSTLPNQCEKWGSYSYVPMTTRYILIDFLALKEWIKRQSNLENPLIKTKNLKFLDAGSGIGNILFLSNAINLATHYTGIEFNKPTFDLSKKVLNLPRKKFKIILGDILIYKKYNNLDILYYYCPFKNPLLEICFEELLEDEASLGTILIFYLKQSHKIVDDIRFTKITLNINITHTSSYMHYFSFYVKTTNTSRVSSDLSQFSKRSYHRYQSNLSKEYKTKIDKHISNYT